MNKIIQESIENVTTLTGSRQLTLWKREDLQHPQPDVVAEEVPVALVYNGISHVVMMASPKDLEHFAMGFSLSEGIIESPQDIYGTEVVPSCNGLEVQVELSSRRFMGLKERRRALAGRTGCGVCGVEQLNDIGKPVQPLAFTQTFNPADLDRALKHLHDFQPVGQLTAVRTQRPGSSRRGIWREGMKMWAVTWRWINCSGGVQLKAKHGGREPF